MPAPPDLIRNFIWLPWFAEKPHERPEQGRKRARFGDTFLKSKVVGHSNGEPLFETMTRYPGSAVDDFIRNHRKDLAAKLASSASRLKTSH